MLMTTYSIRVSLMDWIVEFSFAVTCSGFRDVKIAVIQKG